MQRITVSVDDALAQAFDDLVAEGGVENRSEYVRDLMRLAVEARRRRAESGDCVANLSYIYNYRERALAERLTAMQHDHHDIVIAATHVHLDHRHRLESLLLKGSVKAVHALSDRIQSERGVRFGSINLIAVEVEATPHTHGGAVHAHNHVTPRRG